MKPLPHTPSASRRPRDQRGVVSVELALVLMPLVLLLAAVADLGRAFYTYNNLAKSVRGATRYLTLVNPVDDTARLTARNLVLYGNPDGTGTLQDAGLAGDKVAITICTATACEDHKNVATDSGTTVNLVSVSVSGYAYASVFSTLLPASLDFSTVQVTMRAHP